MILDHDKYKEQLDKGMREIHEKFDKQKNKHKKVMISKPFKESLNYVIDDLNRFPVVLVWMGTMSLFNFIRKKIIERKLKNLKTQNDVLKKEREA